MVGASDLYILMIKGEVEKALPASLLGWVAPSLTVHLAEIQFFQGVREKRLFPVPAGSRDPDFRRSETILSHHNDGQENTFLRRWNPIDKNHMRSLSHEGIRAASQILFDPEN